jgi:hypothetical protein
MTKQEIDTILAARAAVRKAQATEEDDLFVSLCSFIGGQAMVERTEERHEVRLWLRQHLSGTRPERVSLKELKRSWLTVNQIRSLPVDHDASFEARH